MRTRAFLTFFLGFIYIYIPIYLYLITTVSCFQGPLLKGDPQFDSLQIGDDAASSFGIEDWSRSGIIFFSISKPLVEFGTKIAKEPIAPVLVIKDHRAKVPCIDVHLQNWCGCQVQNEKRTRPWGSLWHPNHCHGMEQQ